MDIQNNPVLISDLEQITDNRELWEDLRGAGVLITGATGTIGSMLVRAFHRANERYGLGVKITGRIRDIGKAERVFGSLAFGPETDICLVREGEPVPAGTDRTYIIHTVSPTTSRFFIEHPVETIRASVESTVQILEYARTCSGSVRAVYLSSMEQYGVPYEKGQVMTEDRIGVIDHLNVRSSYSESKRLCECLCASYASEYGLQVSIARLAQTFGAGIPLSDGRMPMQFARAAAEGRDIVLHTEGRSVSNFVYLADAVTGILSILLKGAPGEAYNVCFDSETRRVREIAELVAEKAAEGAIGVKVEIPRENPGYAPDVDMRLCSAKLRDLGWNARVGMEEAYRRMVRYLREAEDDRIG